MKKLFFGLLAVVLFNGVSIAKEINTKKYDIISIIQSVSKSETINIENPVIYCRDFSVEVSIGIASISTNVTICCRPGAGAVPGTGTFYCWVANVVNPDPDVLAGYVEIRQLNTEIQDAIKKGKLTSLKITKSTISEIEGSMIKIKTGEHKIIEVDGISYLQLLLEKV